jgi:pilus assembly protein CpaF
VLGLDPLADLLDDPGVREVLVVGPHEIFVERGAGLTKCAANFRDEECLRAAIARLTQPLGRSVDGAQPLLAAVLPDGAQLSVALGPSAARTTTVHVRKRDRAPLTLDQLLDAGAISAGMAGFLSRAVRARKNILVAGGCSSGKTSLLNVLTAAIPDGERIVVLERAPELHLSQPHAVAMRAGAGSLDHALRLLPSRLVVDGVENDHALELLHVLSADCTGSFATIEAHSPEEALRRLEYLAQAGWLAATRADAQRPLARVSAREQIAQSIQLIAQQTRYSDGSRKLSAICEVAGLDRGGRLRLRTLYAFEQAGVGHGGEILGSFEPTGQTELRT